MKLKFLLFFTLLSAVASAQTESPTSKLTILSIDGRIMDLKYESVGAIETVYAFKNQRSEPFEYRGPQTVVFFRELSQTDENGNPLRLEVATCQLPTSGGQYLLIISKLEGEKEAYRAFPIEDNWDTFSAGTYRFLNLAPFTIALKLDETVYKFEKLNFTDVSGNFENNTHKTAIMVSLPDGEDPTLIFEGLMYYTENQRMLYIISPKSGGRPGRVSMTAVPEVVPTKNSAAVPSAQ
jgi:hypothetical protein